MNRFFSLVKRHNDNLYIADYTNATRGMVGVKISEIVFDDIDYFSITNPIKHNFCSVNFEENILADDLGHKVSQCECICASDDMSGWVCFIELKYCSDKNIRGNMHKAYSQLESTYSHLKNKNVLVGRNSIYLIISIPKKVPFNSFVFTPNELQRIKREKGYIVRGVNSIEIKDGNRLKV